MEKEIYDIINFDYLLNSWRCTCKKPRGNNIICRLHQGLWLLTQRKVRTNTTRLWPTQRNRHSHNDAIKKHKSESLLLRCRHRVLWHHSRYAARRHISPLPLYHLFRLCASDKMKDNGFKLTKERTRRYPTQTIMDMDYANDIALLANALAQAETLLHSLKRAAAGIGLHVNTHKMEYMCFNQRGYISTLNGSSLKLVDKSTYLGSSVSSTKTDINMQLAKAWTAIDRLTVIWKSDLTNKMKRSFFQAAVISILLYEWTTWMLTEHMEKKLDSNYTRMLQAILNKSRRQCSTKQQQYGHLPPITKNNPRKTNQTWGTQLEKLGQTHKWHTPVNLFIWMSKGRTNS